MELVAEIEELSLDELADASVVDDKTEAPNADPQGVLEDLSNHLRLHLDVFDKENVEGNLLEDAVERFDSHGVVVEDVAALRDKDASRRGGGSDLAVKANPLRRLDEIVKDGLARLRDERPDVSLEMVAVRDGVDYAFIDHALELNHLLTDRHIGKEARLDNINGEPGMTDVPIAVLLWIEPDDPMGTMLTNTASGAFGVRVSCQHI